MSLASDLAQYEADRRELILQDRALRADHVRDDLSQAEINADAALRNIRAAEAATIWSAEYPTIPHPFPGMEFLTGQSLSARVSRWAPSISSKHTQERASYRRRSYSKSCKRSTSSCLWSLELEAERIAFPDAQRRAAPRPPRRNSQRGIPLQTWPQIPYHAHPGSQRTHGLQYWVCLA